MRDIQRGHDRDTLGNIALCFLGDLVHLGIDQIDRCLQGLSRYGNDLQNGLLEADYIVVEMARDILGENWMAEYVNRANQGGIERVLV